MTASPNWAPLTTPDEYFAPGGGYSHLARTGDLLFISGTPPKDPRSRTISSSEISGQTFQALANVSTLLAADGLGLADLVAVNIYLSDLNEFEAFDAAFRQAVPEPYPTRTVVGVHLPPGHLIRISAIAARRPANRATRWFQWLASVIPFAPRKPSPSSAR